MPGKEVRGKSKWWEPGLESHGESPLKSMKQIQGHESHTEKINPDSI